MKLKLDMEGKKSRSPQEEGESDLPSRGEKA